MKKRCKLFLLFGLVLILLVGCNSGRDRGEEGAENQEQIEVGIPDKSTKNDMIIAMNSPDTLNPLYNTQANVQQALYLIFSPLINIQEDGTITGNLAESWVINEQGTVVTITLNEGIKWHDGNPLTTDDVLFTLDQIKKIDNSPYKIAVENIASVEKIDHTTFKIIYKQAFSGILQTLFFPVIPKHIYNVEGNDSLNIIPVGSGPYVYESMTPLKNIILKSNSDYFKGKPNIQTVKINIIPDESSSLYAFKQGLIDVIYTGVTDWGKYINSKGSTAYEMVSNIYEFMGLNFSKSLFQNEMIREALIYGIDRESIVHLYYLDHAVVTDTPVSPSSYLYDKTLEIKPYDKEKARLLLTQEGYEINKGTGIMEKNGVPFSFTLLVNKENTDRVKVAQQMQIMYKEVGIDMKIEEVEQESYIERIQNKQYDAFLGGWQLSYATDLSFALHSGSVTSGENYVGYKDEQMDTLLRNAFTSSQTTVYKDYQELQQYFMKKNPYISLYFKKSVMITNNEISGEIQPTPLNVFANVEKWIIK